MAFCNSCGAALNPGIKFYNKCAPASAACFPVGAPQADAVAAAGATPAPPATVIAAAPPPSTGGGSALKIILIVVAVIVSIGILGMVTCGVVVRRALLRRTAFAWLTSRSSRRERAAATLQER